MDGCDDDGCTGERPLDPLPQAAASTAIRMAASLIRVIDDKIEIGLRT
ncbi:MAG: hypothetical protein ACM3SQ_07145 [Betaproteobacteria bacterium]